jgi:tetratricopeptide (TPR) repeat protein
MTHWQEAISYYRRVLELNPDISDPNFFFNFAMALVKIGDHDAAIRRFTLAIQLNIDKVAEAYYQQGTALKELRRDQEAIAAFENQLQKKNDDELAGKAYFNLAELYQKQDNWEAAVRANDGATRLRPDDAFSWDRLGFVLNNVGRFAESAEAHRKAAMLRPDRFEYQFRLGKQLYRADKYREAIEVLTKATELQPKSSEAFYFLGVSYRSNEQYDQAVAALTTALELGLRPRSVEGSARYNLAVAYKKSGNVSAARQHCDLVKLMGSDYPGDSQNVCGP